MKFSIIIPTLNEKHLIGSTIEACLKAGAGEIIVSDGGSTDGTLEIAQRLGCLIVEGNRGRGTQLRAGAEEAAGELLLFVHADSQLDASCLKQLQDYRESQSNRNCWGCFRQEIRQQGFLFRWLETGNAWRAAKRGYVYGDQAMWITQDLYESIGGFSNAPLMEDVIISERLRKIGSPVVLPGPVSIPGRHWEKRGVVRTTIRNWLLFQKYKMGVDPENIARKY